MKQKPIISVIIPVANNVNLTIKCLDSIRKQAVHGALETIIVDNASTNDTPKKIRQKFPDTEILVQKQNLNFSQAVNIGARSAKGKLLFITNNDVIFETDFFQKLLEFVQMPKRNHHAASRDRY